jgi:nucleoside-diphosphate-sugar epimerase
MRVLVTGHKGYIGSVLAPMLVEHGLDVLGVDVGLYDGCTLVPDRISVPELRRDIRDLSREDVRGFDAVVHLAALSNDPLGNLRSGWTEAINCAASIRLAALARSAGVRRFLLSSSCIMYGLSEVATVDESSPLAPATAYARSKVEAERGIAELADRTFSPVFLRNGTVYGLSPRMRFDTVFNNLLGAGFTSKRVVVFSDGTPWRPVIHVEDVARAFIAMLEAPIETVHNQAFNVGADELNHQIRELADVVSRTIPGCQTTYVARPDADQRTYKASFAKIKRMLPTFQPRWDIASAAERLYREFQAIGLDHATFTDPRFTRVAWLQHLLRQDRLDADLRWSQIGAHP